MNVRARDIAVGAIALALALTGVFSSAAATASAVSPTPPQAAVAIDGVHLAVVGRALPPATILVAPAGNAQRTATAAVHHPYRELTITALPFGSRGVSEALKSLSRSGGAQAARSDLHDVRVTQSAQGLGGVHAMLFGQDVVGDANLVNLQLESVTSTPTVIVEWVVESGPRIWLLRTAAQVGRSGTASALATVADVSVTSSDATAPSTPPAKTTPRVPVAMGSGVQAVPSPTWWNGTCDSAGYAAAAAAKGWGSIAAYPLSAGANWNGLVACGPRPFYNEGPDVAVLFPGARWGVQEWECVELSMRWMYLAWGVEPYPANGKDVVWNYQPTKGSYNPTGPSLVTVANDGGSVPQPGDVLSYGATSTFGHTSVVTSTAIDGVGNGTVTVLEENASSGGVSNVPVASWILGGYSGGVSGWLHNGGFNSGPSNARVAASGSDGTVRSLSGSDTTTPVFGSAWMHAGGSLTEAPVVVSIPPTGMGLGTPLYVATGGDHNVWIRSEASVWQPLSPNPVYCTGTPGATAALDASGTSAVLTVACRGGDGALWYVTGPASSDPLSLPRLSGWASLGGAILDGPAVLPMPSQSGASTLLFLANQTAGVVASRTLSSDWSATGWGCVGHLAAAAVKTAIGAVQTFACQGRDGAVWVAVNRGGGWTTMSLGGQVLSGPGIALSTTSWTVVAEGTDKALWQNTIPTGDTTPDGWTSSGGILAFGAAATALVPHSASP